MNNVIYSALLIWVKALHLADADCTIPDVANTYVIRDDQCKDITMACERGYRMRSLISCINGFWDFEDPVCEPVQCLDEPKIIRGALDTAITSRNFGDQHGFSCNKYFTKGGNKGTVTCTETGEWETNITCEDCFSRGKGISYTCRFFAVGTEDECNQDCSDTACTVVTYFAFPDEDGSNCYICYRPILREFFGTSLAECIQKCNDLLECLTLNHYEDVCNLFNATIEALVTLHGLKVGHQGAPSEIIAEKNTCPPIL